MKGWMLLLALGVALPQDAARRERTESFDRDPGWEGVNNRRPAARTVRQDFGHSPTRNAGGKAVGEIGGFLSPAAEPAWYARKLPAKSFDDPLEASGVFASDGRPFHALLGFFNDATVNEWRTPSTIALRLMGRGESIYAWLEYCSRRWRAGGDDPRGFPTEIDPQTKRPRFKGYAVGASHAWSLKYDPKANGGAGAVTATIDGDTAICHLDPGHRKDGASFNRFGLLAVSKSADGGGSLWLDDLAVNGEAEGFDRDPGWDGFQNRRTYESREVRPAFDFGHSATRFAGGKGSGELGGLVFRGDCRFPDRMASYGDRLGSLTLEKPLRAAGKLALTRGVTDSTTLLGFYHSTDSMASNPSQDSGIPKCFAGIAIEGPSREGFQVYPLYRLRSGEQANASGGPHLLPDGATHDWTFEYDGTARMRVTLDGKEIALDLGKGHRAAGARFDRFGLVTTWIDGNGQRVTFDDLTYTAAQE